MRRTVFLAMLPGAVLAGSLSACSGEGVAPETGPGATTSTVVSAPAGTDPGTDLDLGEAAMLVWQPATSVTGVLELSVDAVAEQPRSVFDGWARDDVMAASRPYFVTVSLKNTGDPDLGGFDVPLYLRDDTGALGAPWTVGGDFTACQSGPLPTPFESGAEAQMCLVYLVPGGARIRDLVFEPTEGFDPISWTGEVTKPEKPAAKPRKAGSRKGRG